MPQCIHIHTHLSNQLNHTTNTIQHLDYFNLNDLSLKWCRMRTYRSTSSFLMAIWSSTEWYTVIFFPTFIEEHFGNLLQFFFLSIELTMSLFCLKCSLAPLHQQNAIKSPKSDYWSLHNTTSFLWASRPSWSSDSPPLTSWQSLHTPTLSRALQPLRCGPAYLKTLLCLLHVGALAFPLKLCSVITSSETFP